MQGSTVRPGGISGCLFLLQSVDDILAEKGEGKNVGVSLYIEAGFRIGFLLFLISLPGRDTEKEKYPGIYFLHLGK